MAIGCGRVYCNHLRLSIHLREYIQDSCSRQDAAYSCPSSEVLIHGQRPSCLARGVARLSFTARVERGPSEAARFASKKGSLAAPLLFLRYELKILVYVAIAGKGEISGEAFPTPSSIMRLPDGTCEVWSRRSGLNGRPAVYETAALPTELRRPSRRNPQLTRVFSQPQEVFRSMTEQRPETRLFNDYLSLATGCSLAREPWPAPGRQSGSCSLPYCSRATFSTCPLV